MNNSLAYNLQLEFDFGRKFASTIPTEELINAKPFIKWVGGKGQLIPFLLSRLPEDFDDNITTYIEPFIGGGAFFFWLLAHRRLFKKIIINDANPDLVNVYQIIRNSPEDLIEILLQIKAEYTSLMSNEERRAFFEMKRNVFNSGKETNLEHAANLIFLNKTCYNGLYRVNSKGMFNVPHGRSSSIPLICDPETIRADSKALANVDICCGDFSSVLTNADEKSFIYFDPPYRPLSKTSNFCSYCEGGFDDNEQRRLADCCRALNSKGVRWLLSNSDPKDKCPNDDFFDVLYKGFNIQSVKASRMINSNPQKRGKTNELLISNF